MIMKEQFQRTAMLLGEEAIEKLNRAHVAVFGIGGVGGFCVEALARAGVGALDLIDSDIVCESNLNRQIIATYDTIGRPKVLVAKERVESINPDCIVRPVQAFVLTETDPANNVIRCRNTEAQGASPEDLEEDGGSEKIVELDLSAFDYIVDAIDTVSGKLAIIETAKRAGVPVISSMGTGNKMDPSALRVADLYQTSVCPLARVMRRECRKRGIDQLEVVYSTETPVSASCPQDGKDSLGMEMEEQRRKKIPPGSNSFVPPTAGLLLASVVIRYLIK